MRAAKIPSPDEILRRRVAARHRGEISGEIAAFKTVLRRLERLADAFELAERPAEALGVRQAAGMVGDDLRQRYTAETLERGGPPGGTRHDPGPRANSRADVGY